MGKCSVKGCTSYQLKSRRQTFSFPDSPEMCEKWARAIGRPGLTAGRYSRVCLFHFTPEDVEKFHRVDGKITNIPLKRLKLHPGAIPSVFPGKPHPEVPEECTYVYTSAESTKPGSSQFLNEIYLNDSVFEMDVKQENNPIVIAQGVDAIGSLLLCQVCESTEDLIDISEQTNAYFREELRKVTYFQDDQLAAMLKYICRQCGDKLEDMNAFRNQYEFTYKKLLERIIRMESDVPDAKIHVPAKEEPPKEAEGDAGVSLNSPGDENSGNCANDWTVYDSQTSQDCTKDVNEEEEVSGNICQNDQKDSIESHLQETKKGKRRKGKCCKICKKWMKNRYEVEQHQILHKGDEKKPTCKLCDKKFQCDANLSRHIKTIHENRRDYVCHICKKTFSQSGGLKGHMFVHQKSIYECDICFGVFKSPGYLKMHKYKHVPVEEQTEKMKKVLQRLQRNTAKSNMKNGKHIGRICPICGKYVTTPQQLASHMRCHTGEKPFRCATCGTCFRERNTLRTHMLLHTGERPYKCSLCNAAFRQKTHLKGHMKLHTGEKPHKCLVCGKDFRVKWNLNDHMRLHTGEKPFHCRLCPEKFTNARVLRDHYKKIHFKGQNLRTPTDIQRKLDEVLKETPGSHLGQ